MFFAQTCLRLNWEKMRFDCNFWLGGPIDTRSMCLNCILQDLFRDIPLDHIWRAQIRLKIQSNTSKGRRYIYLGKIHFLTSVSICSRTKNVNFQKKGVFVKHPIVHLNSTMQCCCAFKTMTCVSMCNCTILQLCTHHIEHCTDLALKTSFEFLSYSPAKFRVDDWWLDVFNLQDLSWTLEVVSYLWYMRMPINLRVSHSQS